MNQDVIKFYLVFLIILVLVPIFGIIGLNCAGRRIYKAIQNRDKKSTVEPV